MRMRMRERERRGRGKEQGGDEGREWRDGWI